MGVVADRGLDGGDATLVVEHYLGLSGLEIDGTSACPRLGEHVVHRVQVLEMRHQCCVFTPQGGILVHQDGGHLEDVSEARSGAHHGFVEAGAAHFAVAAHVHLAHHGQPVHQGVDGAEAVGQHLRQHGDDTIGEIHRVAALLAFMVQRRARQHVMGDVGDRHQHPENVALGFAIHRIVEIPGILAVDGDQRRAAQVQAPLLGGFRYLRAQTPDFLFYFRRHHMGQRMGMDGEFRGHARGVAVTHDAGDTADDFAVLAGLLGDGSHHHLPMARAAAFFPGDLHRVGDA